MTRSMSRESGPTSVDPADGQGPRSTSKRRKAHSNHSSAYGAYGRSLNAADPSAIANADSGIVAAISASVRKARARSVQALGVDRFSPGVQTAHNDLSDIQEEDDLVDAGDSEAESDATGNGIPTVTAGNSRSFGTEDPILGAMEKAQSEAGSSKTTGGSSKSATESFKVQHQKATLKKHRTSGSPSAQLHHEQNQEREHEEREYRLHRRQARQNRRQASTNLSFMDRLTMIAWGFPLPQWLLFLFASIFKIFVVATLLYGMYEGALRIPAFKAFSFHSDRVSINHTSSYDMSPTPLYMNQYNTLIARLENVENAVRAIPAHYDEPDPPRVNFFSRGLGAMTDPHLTSPSNKHNYQARAWHRWGLGTYTGNVPGPADALMPWEDVGDCWCAAPSGGKSQLAVMLPNRIIPTHLVVEHIPKGATLGIGAAPKDLELWVQILDNEKRAPVQAAADNVRRRSTSGPDEDLDDTKRADDFQAEKSLDRTWVRIASFRYDIHAPRHVQTFKIDVQLDYWGLAANKVVIRVKNNWGPSDFTCLYRLKLHGNLAEPPRDEYAPEYLLEKKNER